MITSKETLGVRVLKHGLMALTIALLLTASAVLLGQIVERSVADLMLQQRGVAALGLLP